MKGRMQVSEKKRMAREAVIQIAVECLGRIALQDRQRVFCTPSELEEMYQALFDVLEVLNDEKEDN